MTIKDGTYSAFRNVVGKLILHTVRKPQTRPINIIWFSKISGLRVKNIQTIFTNLEDWHFSHSIDIINFCT
jgi:hypothetical protein